MDPNSAKLHLFCPFIRSRAYFAVLHEEITFLNCLGDPLFTYKILAKSISFNKLENVLICCGGPTLTIWNIKHTNYLMNISSLNCQNMSCCTYYDEQIAVGDESGRIEIWIIDYKALNYSFCANFQENIHSIRDIIYIKNGSYLVSMDLDINIWNTSDYSLYTKIRTNDINNCKVIEDLIHGHVINLSIYLRKWRVEQYKNKKRKLQPLCKSNIGEGFLGCKLIRENRQIGCLDSWPKIYIFSTTDLCVQRILNFTLHIGKLRKVIEAITQNILVIMVESELLFVDIPNGFLKRNRKGRKRWIKDTVIHMVKLK